MDKLNRYRGILKNLLSDLAKQAQEHPTTGVEALMIADTEHDQYLLLTLGWAERRRVRHLRVFLRLLNDKIWIEEDWTEDGIAEFLVQAGVPKEDIVLGFYSPEQRKQTEFAIA